MVFIFSVAELIFRIKNIHEGLHRWIHAHFITTNFCTDVPLFTRYKPCIKPEISMGWEFVLSEVITSLPFRSYIFTVVFVFEI